MDFLSIRKKARERSEAKAAATGGPAPAAPEEATAPVPAAGSAPAPPELPPEPARVAPPASAAPFAERRRGERRRTRGDEPVLTEQDLVEGALQARFQGLQPTPDGRFATWRPGAGPPPVGPDVEVGPEAAPSEAAPPAVRPPSTRPPRPPPPAPAEEADPLATFFYRPDEDAGSVPLLGGGPGEEPAAPVPDALDEFLTFTLGGEEYAVGIEHVREVLRAPAITEVPRAPAHVLGVVTVRGEVVAIVDARRRLGLPAGHGGGGSRIVLVETGVGPLGLLVDSIANVVRLPRGSIEPCPQGISSVASDCVTGIGRWHERLFMVVDVGALLGRRPGDALPGAGH